jgi:hypothetical protein
MARGAVPAETDVDGAAEFTSVARGCSTPGQARAADGGSKLPHSTWRRGESASEVVGYIEERFFDCASGASRKSKGAGRFAQNDGGPSSATPLRMPEEMAAVAA